MNGAKQAQTDVKLKSYANQNHPEVQHSLLMQIMVLIAIIYLNQSKIHLGLTIDTNADAFIGCESYKAQLRLYMIMEAEICPNKVMKGMQCINPTH